MSPVAALLAGAGVPADAVTIAGLVLAILAGARVASGHLLTGGILLLLGGLADALDGSVSRLRGTASRFGAFFDSTLDRYAECAIFLGLLFYYRETAASRAGLYATFLAATGSLLVSYARARAEGIGVACAVGLLSRSGRLVLLIAGLVFGRVPLLIALIAIAALAHLTALQRLIHVRRALVGEAR